jgi:MoaA/NifB/PqqE/SkfB family radical SAM enzyme
MLNYTQLPSLAYRMMVNFLTTKIGFYRPRSAELAVNYACNLSCKHCSRSELDQGELSFDLLKHFFKSFRRLGGVFVTFTGGEPTLRDDLVELVSYATNQAGLLVSVTTNATLLNDEMLYEVHKAGLHGLNISLYGIAEEHDTFVNCQGAFDGTIDAARHAKRLFILFV